MTQASILQRRFPPHSVSEKAEKRQDFILSANVCCLSFAIIGTFGNHWQICMRLPSWVSRSLNEPYRAWYPGVWRIQGRLRAGGLFWQIMRARVWLNFSLFWQPADTIQTWRKMQDNRFAAGWCAASSIRVEKSSQRIKIVMLLQPSDDLCWSVTGIDNNQGFRLEIF